jgi:multidrug resistance efflux pump
MPLQSGEVVHGVLTVERRESPVSADETFELRLLCDACALPLSRLHDADRWFGARLGSSLLRWRSQVLGPGHVAWKLAGVAGLLLTLVLAFLPWDYRIEAPVALRSKDLLFVPAPFDGYLRDVNVEVGDTVAAGAVMLALDTRELVLEESMAVADELRVRREAEKSQAGRQFGDMQIALARQQASASKLELIRHQVGQAQVKAPFAGMVVEGELKKNLGAPVRKGDLLLKLASTGATYLEIEIDQAKIHEVAPGMRGEFAFVGRPELRYPLVIDRVDPVSSLREGRNIFLARAHTEVAYQSWWRPGMGGAARLDAGERRLIWVLTERTVRFLRHTFWL